ncbi:g8578 [Coccomyxa viridis]|uniref:G8578 protein n=1 Tax=Coccomyxa viridis TaxID=1274662 RepID=A0ABP1G1T0_9CHLO
MELTNKNVRLAVSNPGQPGPCERRLDLGQPRFDGKHPPSQQASRWLEKRVRRYSHIVCVFRNPDDCSFPEETVWGIPTCSIPPLLPFLLAGCASSTLLSLTVAYEGDKFLTMLSGGDAPSAIGDPTSFTEELKKRLIELTLVLYPSKAPLLENISMLTALQRLELRSCFTPGWSGELYRDLAGQTVVLKLPHLTSLWLEYLENGELVVLCPKLAEARFKAMASMRMAVKEAALTNLVVGGMHAEQLSAQPQRA